MSSLGSQGLTPLPTGPTELEISTGLNNLSGGHESVIATKNPEEDKVRRLQEVVKLLKTRFIGRGICREGVERLAKLAGFTDMWQGDTLAIAGTCVDLEITFDGMEKDKVKDVVLKIFTSESEEHKKDASEVLKANLELVCDDNGEPWRSLEVFATNLEHLGRMDQLSQGINCFEAIDGLYATFRKIWDGETRRIGRRRMLDHLSQGTIGRPVLNRDGKLGLSIEYWAEQRQLHGLDPDHAQRDAMQLDTPRTDSEHGDHSTSICKARIDCEAGYPSIRISKDWIADEIFENTKREKVTGTNEPLGAISWIEPAPTLVRPAENANNPNEVDTEESDIKMPKPPEVRFLVHLEPPVLVPLAVASTISNRQGLSVALNDSKFTTLDQALRNLASNSTQSKTTAPVPSFQRWKKSANTFDRTGKAVNYVHSYTFHSMPQIWCYPVHSLTFDHPKHLAELLPTLRQYSLLWTLLRSVASGASAAGIEAADQVGSLTTISPAQNSKISSKRGVVKRNNMDLRREKVNALLRAEENDAMSRKTSSLIASASDPTVPIPVDVSLSLTPSNPSRPRLDLIWPLPRNSGLTGMKQQTFASVSIEIGPNGEIIVPSASGIPFAEFEQGLGSIARSLALGEDIGLLLEWAMEKQRESRP